MSHWASESNMMRPPAGMSGEAGFDPCLLQRALDIVRRGAGTDPAVYAYPGAVVAVMRGGQLAVCEAVGYADLEPEPRPMRLDHVFDAASLTKVVAAATSILILLEQGLLCLDDRLARFFPELRNQPLGGVSIRQLLTHTSGLPGWLPLYQLQPRDGSVVETLAAVPLGASPGARVEYSCLGFILLGRLVESLAGVGLAEFVAREIATPLGMVDTRYLPLDRLIPAELEPRLVPTERRSASEQGTALLKAVGGDGTWVAEWEARHPDGRARGMVHDENAAWLGGVSGNAGLFTTAADLLSFGLMWLNAGKSGDNRILSPRTIMASTRNHTAGMGENRGLGWQLPSPDTSFGDLVSPACFGHTGFTGTGLWVDPWYDLVVVLLTNRLQFGRENQGVHRIRRLFLNALLAGLR